MKLKQMIASFTALVLGTALLAGCGGAPASSASATAPSAPQPLSGEITVVSREDGSGTRGAFIELFGIEQKDADGKKIDHTTEEANITNNTAVMITTVAGDTAAIGYISLGSLGDTVKALQIDGAAPTVENIQNGTYKISRPFNIVTSAEASPAAQDFIHFILSADGQAVVSESGYIALENASAYEAANASGEIVVAGSSSVSPVMEKLKEAYLVLNPDASIEIQQSDSTTGTQSTMDGICDIGMASRELKDSEKEAGLTGTVIATDGIAVIVNKTSPLDGLTIEQVMQIFTAEVLDWADVA